MSTIRTDLRGEVALRDSKRKKKTSNRYSGCSLCCDDLSCRGLPTSQYQIVIGVIRSGEKAEGGNTNVMGVRCKEVFALLLSHYIHNSSTGRDSSGTHLLLDTTNHLLNPPHTLSYSRRIMQLQQLSLPNCTSKRITTF